MAIEPIIQIDELDDCPPATDPDCPACGQTLSVIGGSVYLLWACGNSACRDSNVYIWDNGELVVDCWEA